MNIKQIERGKWYNTTMGIGQCIRVGGTRPPSVEINIIKPIPRGIIFLKPREILYQVSDKLG